MHALTAAKEKKGMGGKLENYEILEIAQEGALQAQALWGAITRKPVMYEIGQNFVAKISPTMTKEELHSMAAQLREIVKEDEAQFKMVLKMQPDFIKQILEADKAQMSTFPEATLFALEEHLKTLP